MVLAGLRARCSCDATHGVAVAAGILVGAISVAVSMSGDVSSGAGSSLWSADEMSGARVRTAAHLRPSMAPTPMDPVALPPTNPVHVAMSLCSISGDPGVVALKSILLSDAQHGAWAHGDVEGGGGGGGGDGRPIHFHLVLDGASRTMWEQGHWIFAEVRAVLNRHPMRYAVTVWPAESLAEHVAAALAAEGATPSAINVNINMFKTCSGARLLLPLALRSLHRVIYLDFDTVTLCDIRRLDDRFDTFTPTQAVALAQEDPSGGNWTDGWYVGHRLPTGTPGGVNAGVFLFDIARLKATMGGLAGYWRAITEIVSTGVYAPLTGGAYGQDLGDQDVLNVLLYKRPELLHLLPPRWSTMQPLVRIRNNNGANYVPDAPCLIHYNAGGYQFEAGSGRIGNGAFKWVRDWQMA